MPVEVRELVIKGVIAAGDGGGAGSAATAGGNESQDEIVKACVEKVLEILKEKLER
jgi:hypothetical protein